MPITSSNRIRGRRRPFAASARLLLVLLLVVVLLLLPPTMAAIALAHAHDGAEAAAAVSLNDDDGAESPWREATPTSRPGRKPHASASANANTNAKEDRGLQQQATPAPTRPPTRVPTRPPTRAPTRAPTRKPTRAPTGPTKQPTRRPTVRPTQWPTAGPTRKAPPPTHVTLGGRSYDKVVVTAVAALGAIALLSIFGVIAYWCCRRPAQACIASLGPRRRRNPGGAAGASSSNTTGGGGGPGQHLAVASLYYDADEQAHPERYRAFRTPPRRTGTLIGRALDDQLSQQPPALATVPLSAPLATGPLPPPVSPQFDPFGRAAIEYMGPSGAWPPTPRAVRERQRAAVGVAAGTGAGAEEEEEDDYGELVRLLMTTATAPAAEGGQGAEQAGPEPVALLHPSDLRMEPLPFSATPTSARHRGRLGCTLPPPLPVVALASPVAAVAGGSSSAAAAAVAPVPVPATDSTRDLGMVVTATAGAGGEEGDDGAEGDPGVPVVVTVLYALIPPGAAPAAHAALARRAEVAAAYPGHFAPVLGVCGRGDKRRLALVEGAWPPGRPLPEALPLLVVDADGGNDNANAHRRRAAAFLRVGLQLAEALAYLHAAGLGHGAVLPGNVLLDRRTLQAKLTGARVAELLGSSQPVDGLMEEGGNGEEEDAALYLAPECWTTTTTTTTTTAAVAPAAASSTSSADVYALAVLLWGVWARQRPYAGLRLTRAELREAVCDRGLRPTSAAASVAWDAPRQQQASTGSAAPPPPELPSAFEALLADMWSPDPRARPSAALVAARLRALQAAMD